MPDPIKEAQGLLLAELKKSKADRDEDLIKELKEFLMLTQASGQYAGLFDFSTRCELLQIACREFCMTLEGVVGCLL